MPAARPLAGCTTADTPGVCHARARGHALGILLAVLGVGGMAYLVFLAPGSPLREPQSAPGRTVLLDHDAPLRADGTELSFTVRQPSRIRIWMTLPEGRTGTVRFGVPGSTKKGDIAYRPLEEQELVFEVTGAATTPFERTVMAVGIYILRVDPLPDVAPGALVHARVTAEPVIGN